MKRISLTIILVVLFIPSILFSKEGIWLPFLVEKLNYEDLKACGFKLSAKDIYNLNKASLSDAVVIFGSGCTGGIVSDEGLLFTNYHCGFGQVQRHTTVENNYIQNGFWATSRDKELPNPGLSVKFLVHTLDVTDLVIENIDLSLTYNEQLPLIQKQILELEKAIEDTSEYDASIESFYEGDNYYLFLYNEFKDVRLVGAPPESIGGFGGDTDNWIWPRHTADFAVFRIYTSPDGKPANYAKENIPYKPINSFTISTQGASLGDFTMVMGYPGSTYEYLYSAELELLRDIIYPNKIKLKTGRLNIIKNARNKNDEIYIQYAVKQSRIANVWKKWKGVLYGFNRFDVIENRKEFEEWLMENAGNKKNQLQEIYNAYEDIYQAYVPYRMAVDYFEESVTEMEVFSLIQKCNEIINDIKKDKSENAKERLMNYGNKHFKDYNYDLDKLLTTFVLKNYINDMDESIIPAQLLTAVKNNNLDSYINSLYESSVFTTHDKYNKAVIKLLKGNQKVLTNDPFYNLIQAFVNIFINELIDDFTYYDGQVKNINKQYLTLIKAIDTTRLFYPDANFTMRMSYGNVKGYSPADAVEYFHQTYLDGMIEKAATGSEEYKLPERIFELYNNNELGKYADSNGRLPLCFIASNHTSGGNSGSPVLDAYGRLIGLNFDRTWESTMSDYNFDERICRNITVDMRYVLFIIEKYGEAGYLLDEMDIVW